MVMEPKHGGQEILEGRSALGICSLFETVII